jgi:hypothetical protein
VSVDLPIATYSNIRVPVRAILWPASNAAGVVTYTSLVSIGFVPRDVFHYPLPRAPDRFTDYELYDVDDWDGYGALPISRETVENARRFFLQIPRRFDYVDIAPGSDGTIGFEWRFGTGLNLSFVLIDVGPGDLVSARKIDPSGKITSFPLTHVGICSDNILSQLFHYQSF